MELMKLQKNKLIFIYRKIENAKNQEGLIKVSMVSICCRKNKSMIINKTKIDNQLEREILGQIKDPKEAYIATVSELSKFIATDAYYKTFRQAVNK